MKRIDYEQPGYSFSIKDRCESSEDIGDYVPARYVRRGRVCADGVRYLYGVDIDKETESRWCSLIYMTRFLDTYLDEFPVGSVDQRISNVIGFIRDREAVSRYFPRLSEARVGETTYAQMLRHGSEVARMKHRVSRAETDCNYIQNRRLEGRLYARLVSCIATDYVQQQPGYERFRHALVPLGELANLMDSFTDVRGDIARNELDVESPFTIRARLLGYMGVSLAQSKTTAQRNKHRFGKS